MTRSAAYARARSAVLRHCADDADALTLRVGVLAAVARAVGFDSHVWLLTDPETSVGAAPLADVPPPLLPALPRLIRLKYLTPVNRWTGLAVPVASLRAATGGDPGRSLLWRELLDGHGVADVASMVFRDRYGCWGFLDLWRATAFTDAELAFLADLAPPVTAALRRCQAATFVRRPAGPRPPGPVVLLLGPDLSVLGQTPQTQEYLRVLVPPAGGRPPIPASAYNVGAQLMAVEAGVDRNPPSARVHLADGGWLRLRAARLDADGPVDSRPIAVTIEDAAPGERVPVFARAYGLSSRESELLAHLAGGTDTRELARLMGLSGHTVQDHLKSIFTKTGSHTRRTLLSQALGT